MTSLFITFEGGEGTGKSTQARLLHEHLTQKGIPSVLTREPGGSTGAELIRELLVKGNADRWDPLEELFLLLVSRRNHWFKTISPALDAGHVVICDRFIDSSRVYQGFAGGVDSAFIEEAHRQALPRTNPDRTYVFDLMPQEGLARTIKRANDDNRFETKTLAFHEKIHAGYQAIAKADPKRCLLIKAEQEIGEIHHQILADFNDLFYSSNILC